MDNWWQPFHKVSLLKGILKKKKKEIDYWKIQCEFNKEDHDVQYSMLSVTKLVC